MCTVLRCICVHVHVYTLYVHSVLPNVIATTVLHVPTVLMRLIDILVCMLVITLDSMYMYIHMFPPLSAPLSCPHEITSIRLLRLAVPPPAMCGDHRPALSSESQRAHILHWYTPPLLSPGLSPFISLSSC